MGTTTSGIGPLYSFSLAMAVTQLFGANLTIKVYPVGVFVTDRLRLLFLSVWQLFQKDHSRDGSFY